MRRSSSRAAAAALILITTSSCTDLTSPTKFRPGAANRDIDLTVSSIALDLLFNGTTIGQSPMGDHCFTLTVDGVAKNNICTPSTIPNLPTGTHLIGLQETVIGLPPGPPTTNVDVQPPISVTLAGGAVTPVSFELSGVRGLVTGTLTVNGQPAPDGQYQVCVDASHCDFLRSGGLPPGPVTPPTGKFSLLARPGAAAGVVESVGGFSHLADFSYTAVAGQAVDVGTINVQLASISLDLLFNGTSIGQSPMGDHCFTLTVDGQSSSFVCGPTTVQNLPAGAHTIGLQQTVVAPPPGPPTSNVDIQPPISVTLLGGQSTAVSFELSGVRGKVSGTVDVNGQPAPDNVYQVCADASHCDFLRTGGFPPAPPTPVTGKFVLLVRPGTAQGFVEGVGGFTHLADFTYTVAAGQTVDVGTVNIQNASIALDLLFNGVSIGQSPMGDHCFTLTVDGQSSGFICGPTTVQNLPSGTHLIGLQQTNIGTPPGPPTTNVDIQPPVSVTLTGGQPTPVSFELSSVRGQVAGTLRVNGQPAPDGQYQVCVDASHCDFLRTGSLPPNPPTPPTGKFVLLARPGAGQGFVQGVGGFSHLADFSYIVAKGLTTLIGGISTAPPGDTPSGASVSVEPVNQTTGTANTTITLNFSNVSSSGTTTVVQSAQGAPPPTGLQLGTPPVYFDLSTNATFTGPVDVCINYTGTTFTDPSNARLLHGDGNGNWTDVTTTHDQVNRIICGSVTSFSPFVVAQRVSAPPPPAQKPTLTPTVHGTLGSGGWYTSDVSIAWNVADNGTPITSQAGCDATQITTNTPGTAITCSATSAGGTSAITLTIKRDANSPTVTPSFAGTLGAGGWYTTDVTVSWGVGNLGPSGASAVCTPSTLTTNSAGTSYSCTATTGAGLAATGTTTVKRDATVPTIAATISGTLGANGWYTSDVGLAPRAGPFGPSAGQASCTPTSVTNDAASAAYSCVATTGAGLSATTTGTIMRDVTKPIVRFAGNSNAYTVDQSVNISCSATDATSGVASATCPSAIGFAYDFALGVNSLAATATDVAGNSASAQTQFTVTLTGDGFAELIKRFVANPKSQKTLLDRLSNILDKAAKGNTQAKDEQIKNFVKEVADIVNDHGISASDAATLGRLVAGF